MKSERLARPKDDWHEDMGAVLWWVFPIKEPPYCGTPVDTDWPGYHTHWTPLIVPDWLMGSSGKLVYLNTHRINNQ